MPAVRQADLPQAREVARRPGALRALHPRQAGGEDPPPAPRRSRARGRDDDFDGDFDDDFGDDPYFYAYAYYEGYGSYGRGEWGHAHARDLDDPVDFTEADGEAFAVERDTDFEHDMGAS